jgi:hypothetical protein
MRSALGIADIADNNRIHGIAAAAPVYLRRHPPIDAAM